MKSNIIRWLNKPPYPSKLIKSKLPSGNILYRLYNGFLETYTPIELNRFKEVINIQLHKQTKIK